MAAYAVTTIDAVPSIDDEGVDWRPIQHYFQLTAFGINVYRATGAGIQVIGDHDERAGRHEEVYVVLEGRVAFTVGDESFACEKGSVVVVKDPAVESPSKLRDLAPADVDVVHSSAAWEDFGVAMSPYFCFVDGASGEVRSEGSAMTWEQVASLLRDALLDEELAART